MKKIILIPLLLLFTTQFNAQDLELILGRNFTTYDYTNSEVASNPNLDGASGSYIEVSYNVPFNRNQDFYYSLGLALNQFNATGGDYASSYSWDTNYLGVKSGLKYYFTSRNSFVKAAAKTGFGINTIINGQQKINGATFDLTQEDEFTAVSVQPYLGIELKYEVTSGILLGVGYNYSKSFGVANGDAEKLNFNNSRFEFGILVPVN